MENLIIHPTDFSECSEKAVVFAANLCRYFKAELLLIHAINPEQILGHENSGRTMLAQSKRMEEEAKDKINQLGNKIVKEYRINCKAHLYQGKLNDWFNQKVSELNPKLVVMGTTGAGSLNNQIFGSNTYAIIRSSTAAVLSIPILAEYKEPKSLSLAIDLESINKNALSYMIEFSKKLKAKLDLVFVNTKGKEISSKEVYNRLNLNSDNADFKIKELRNTNYLDGIVEYIDNNESDIFGIINSNKSAIEKLLFGSLSKRLIHNSKTPLLTIPKS